MILKVILNDDIILYVEARMSEEQVVEACIGCGSPFWYPFPFNKELAPHFFCPICLSILPAPPTIRDSLGNEFNSVRQASEAWGIHPQYIRISLQRGVPIAPLNGSDVKEVTFEYFHPDQRRYRHHIERIKKTELDKILSEYRIEE